MSFIKLVFKPGINRDQTNYSGEGGWSDCDKVRFFSGFPQKLGGWLKTTPETFIGVCRQVWNWITSFTDNFPRGRHRHQALHRGGRGVLRHHTFAGDSHNHSNR
jgi:hypothetical protein